MHRDNLNPEFIRKCSIDKNPLLTILLGEAGGSQKIYVNIDCLPPNSTGTKYHSHTSQEEFFFVLKGTPSLRLDKQLYQLQPGDFFSKPAGKGIAHQFLNESNLPCEILDIGYRDPNDICIYPDDGVAVVNSLQKVFPLESGIKGWTSIITPAD